MTAEEARELMNGSMNYKGIWYKIRLNWFCGCINRRIERAAELNQKYIKFIVSHEDTARQYFPVIARFYEELGYYVAFSYHHGSLKIYWDLSDLSRYTIEELCHGEYYDYHIKLEEPKEDNKRESKKCQKKDYVQIKKKPGKNFDFILLKEMN